MSRPAPAWRRLAITLALAVSLGWPSPATMQQVAEREVQSELLARLPLFVSWPGEGLPAGTDPVVIGILGLDPLGDEIDSSAAGRQVSGRSLTVRRFAELRDMAGRLPPHVLFVSTSERDQYERILQTLAPDPVLLVGEEAAFLQAGGHVTVGVHESRPEVVIALERLRTRGFQVDSRLVEVARLFQLPD